MTVISGLTSISRATLLTGGNISSSEHNAWSQNVITQLNAIGTPAGLLAQVEANFAGAAQPTDKPAGKLWWDSGNSILKAYLTAAGTPAPIPVGLAGSNPYILPDVAARTINISGVDQNSYVSATGTAGADNTAQIVKQITLKANSLNALMRCVRIRARIVSSSGSNIAPAIYFGTAGTTGDLLLGAANASNFSGGTLLEYFVYYVTATTLHADANASSFASGFVTNGTTNINFAADMKISVTQSQTAATHITVYSILVEPIG